MSFSFSNFFKGFISFFEATAPVFVATFAPASPIVGAVVAGIPALMNAVESMSPSANGATKSAAVHAAAQVMYDGLSKNLTGGAQESYQKYQPLIQAVMDNGIAAVNAQATVVVPATPKPVA